MPLKEGSSEEVISTNISHCMSKWKDTGKVSGVSVGKAKAMKMCAGMSYESARGSAGSSALSKAIRERRK